MKIIDKIVAAILIYTVVIGVKLFRIFVNGTISILTNFKMSEKCPAIKSDLLCIPATELAGKIRKGKLSSRQVISTYINRITEVNKIINAVIENRFTEALKEAEKVDELIASKLYTQTELETKFPLLGLPVTIKASIAVKGMIFVAGRYYDDLENRRAKKDADVVRHVKDAGGIILLISSCPELCKNIECFNKIIGTTRNPYDTRRTTGGSSGGEAALLGCGASLIGLGSDMAGSCRLPAAFCGVFGHKPTATSVSLEGHYPDSRDEERWNFHLAIGPMARYSQDLPLLMKVICKPNINKSLKLTQEVDITNLKIFYRYDNGGDPLTGSVDKSICNHLADLVEHLKSKGCYTEEANLKYLNYSTIITIIKLMSINDIDDILDNTSKNVYLEMIKSILNYSNCALFSLFYIAGKRFFDSLSPEKHIRVINKLADILTSSLSDTLKEDGVLIYPVTTGAAFYHGQGLGMFLDISYTGFSNALGFPCVSCPIGFTDNGLPIAVQIIGNFNCDYLTFAVAREIEQAFGGWKPPPFAIVS